MALCVIAGVFMIAANTALAADAPEPVAKTLITNARIYLKSFHADDYFDTINIHIHLKPFHSTEYFIITNTRIHPILPSDDYFDTTDTGL